MNLSLTALESGVVGLAVAILLVDLWLPTERKRNLGYVAAAGLGIILLGSFFLDASTPRFGFAQMYVLDSLALFFKRFFLAAAVLVLLMGVEFADRIRSGVVEYYALLLFALTGMMLAASANDFVMLFASLELITVTFYVLTSFQRARLTSLEAGVKYLILGALSSAFTVYGIALIFGTTNSTNFPQVFAGMAAWRGNALFLMGLALVMVGLGFKIAAVPFQIWAPDVYQGAPAPTTAFLAVGSKAAGFVLLLRILIGTVPDVTLDWTKLLMVISGATILYGNLCAIPQRNLKRLLGYSSIAHAGYLLLGIAAANVSGSSAILYYLSGYLFTVLAAFTVICLTMREVEGEDISAVAGLHKRSPLLAFSLALAMVSLAGIPPLAGFFGKFLLIRALLERSSLEPAYYVLIGVAIVGVIISFYYYLGVVRAVYWSEGTPALLPPPAPATRGALYACIAGMLVLGLFPSPMLTAATRAADALNPVRQAPQHAQHPADPSMPR